MNDPMFIVLTYDSCETELLSEYRSVDMQLAVDHIMSSLPASYSHVRNDFVHVINKFADGCRENGIDRCIFDGIKIRIFLRVR